MKSTSIFLYLSQSLFKVKHAKKVFTVWSGTYRLAWRRLWSERRRDRIPFCSKSLSQSSAKTLRRGNLEDSSKNAALIPLSGRLYPLCLDDNPIYADDDGSLLISEA